MIVDGVECRTKGFKEGKFDYDSDGGLCWIYPCAEKATAVTELTSQLLGYCDLHTAMPILNRRIAVSRRAKMLCARTALAKAAE